MPLSKWSLTAHPASVGETYVQHFGVATSFGTRMVLGGLACFVHGVFPFLFTSTGSRAVGDLHDRMVKHRTRTARPRAEEGTGRAA